MAGDGSGLSPRVRGNLVPPAGGDEIVIRRRVQAEAVRVYPRVCGGTWTAAAPVYPRVMTGGTMPYPGVYPRVCGGTNLLNPGQDHAVYPRVCGGTRPTRFTVGAVYPRVCGGTVAGRYGHRSRSIPACAGEPKPNGNRSRVYPRVCGGTGGNDPTALGQGLSPRVRGNRVTIGILAGACAGDRPV